VSDRLIRREGRLPLVEYVHKEGSAWVFDYPRARLRWPSWVCDRVYWLLVSWH
jgi:hypothetical protein